MTLRPGAMRILLYSLNYAPEPVGIGRYSGELGPWLASQGHDVRAICAPPYFPDWQVGLGREAGLNRWRLEQREGVRVRRCPLWVPRRPSGLTRLLHLASFALSSLPPLLNQLRWRPDVVFCVAPAFFCTPGALLLRQLSGPSCRAWLHIQDFELDAAFSLGMLRGGWLRGLAESWEAGRLRDFDVVSSLGPAMLNRLRAKGVAEERIELLPNWVDLAAIRPQSPRERGSNPYRRELGLREDQLAVMYSGSMNNKQGLDLIAETIVRRPPDPRLVWLLAGEGPTRVVLERVSAGREDVRLLPLQPAERMNDWLNAADIHLLPQKASAADLVLPSKLLGMLASGRPVLACSPVGSELAELADQAGLCVRPDDPQAFLAGLEALLASPRLRLEKGERGRQLAEERYGREAVLTRFEQRLVKLTATAAATAAAGRGSRNTPFPPASN
ncbi:MAG: WcaI family glycosyltransferase [Synechococcaceae cyanobacterium]